MTEQLENRKADVARWVDEAGETAAITATRREELKRNFQLLPTFLDELRPYMVQLGQPGRRADPRAPTCRPRLRTSTGSWPGSALLGGFTPGLPRRWARPRTTGLRAFREPAEEVDELRGPGEDAARPGQAAAPAPPDLDDRRYVGRA